MAGCFFRDSVYESTNIMIPIQIGELKAEHVAHTINPI